MAEPAIRVRGLREFQRAVSKASKETRSTVREGLKKAGEPVREEWVRTFERVDARSASRLRVRSRSGSVLVEQSLRRSADPARRRPSFAVMQLEHGEQALERKSGDVERELEKALDELADIVEG